MKVRNVDRNLDVLTIQVKVTKVEVEKKPLFPLRFYPTLLALVYCIPMLCHLENLENLDLKNLKVLDHGGQIGHGK